MIKKSNEATLGQVIRELLNTYNLTDKLTEVRLVNSWESVVGKMIAKHTINLKVKKRKLFVKLDSAALTNELTYSKSRIIDMLNKEAGEKVIFDIVFR